MAILKMTNMVTSGGVEPSIHLKNALHYILNPTKCDFGRLASAKNCVADDTLAYNTMMQTKRTFGKLHGRQGYHYVLSFLEDSTQVPPETALEITEKFVDRYLQGRYEVVYAVHTDTSHVHSHIVFNSVACDDGSKYHAPDGEWEKAIMPIVNDLCKEHGLSQIKLDKVLIEDQSQQDEAEAEEEEEEHGLETYRDFNNEPENKAKPRGRSSAGDGHASKTSRTAKAPANPKYGRKGSGYGGSTSCTAAMIRRDIDECIAASSTMDEFYQMLQERGYRLRIDGTRAPGLQHETMERIRRFASLGEGYSLEEIAAAIASGEKPEPEPGISKESLPDGFESFDESEKSIPSVLHREMRLRFAVSGEAYSRVAFFSRAKNSIREFEMLRKAYDFVRFHNIQSSDDIQLLFSETHAKWKNAKNGLRAINRRMQDGQTEELMSFVRRYRELSDAVTLYRSGDETFYEEYLEAEKLKDRIRSYGFTVKEAEEKYVDFQEETDRLKTEQKNASSVLKQISWLDFLLQRSRTPEDEAERLEEIAAGSRVRRSPYTEKAQERQH